MAKQQKPQAVRPPYATRRPATQAAAPVGDTAVAEAAASAPPGVADKEGGQEQEPTFFQEEDGAPREPTETGSADAGLAPAAAPAGGTTPATTLPGPPPPPVDRLAAAVETFKAAKAAATALPATTPPPPRPLPPPPPRRQSPQSSAAGQLTAAASNTAAQQGSLTADEVRGVEEAIDAHFRENGGPQAASHAVDPLLGAPPPPAADINPPTETPATHREGGAMPDTSTADAETAPAGVPRRRNLKGYVAIVCAALLWVSLVVMLVQTRTSANARVAAAEEAKTKAETEVEAEKAKVKAANEAKSKAEEALEAEKAKVAAPVCLKVGDVTTALFKSKVGQDDPTKYTPVETKAGDPEVDCESSDGGSNAVANPDGATFNVMACKLCLPAEKVTGTKN